MKTDTTARIIPVWWWLLPVLLLTFWLGAHYLNENPVWGDERNSLRDAGGLFFGPLSPIEIWERVLTGNPWHAPGYFLLLAPWGAFAGWSLPALRVLSLLLGVLAVAWTYRLGRERVSAEVGLFGAAVLGTSMLFAHYLSTARMYTLLAVLSIFSVWAYLRLVNRRTGSPLLWVGLLVGATGLLYTHYFAAMTLIAIGAYHLLFVRKDAHWWRVSGVLALAGGLFLPWLGGLAAGLQRAAEFEALHERAIDGGETLLRLAFLFGNGVPIIAGLTLLLALAAGWRLRAERGVRQLWLLSSLSLGSIIAANAVVQVMHEGRLRYLIGVWGLLALLAGVGLTYLIRLPFGRALAWAGLALWMGIGLMQVSARLIVRDTNNLDSIYPMHRVATVLDGQVQAGDLVVHTILVDELPDIDSPLNEYSPMRQFYFPPDVATLMLQVAGDDDQQDDAQDSVRDLLDGKPRFWLAYQPNAAPETLGDFQSRLVEDYNLCRAETDTPDLRVELYTRVPLCCVDSAAARPLARYGGDIALTGLVVQAEDETGGLPIVTTWEIARTMPVYTYSVSLQAWDAVGALAAQVDYGLELPASSCKQAVLPAAGLPPGTYELRATVYNWQTGERLPGVLESGEAGDLLRVGSFSINE
jgi:hypothetical protein